MSFNSVWTSCVQNYCCFSKNCTFVYHLASFDVYMILCCTCLLVILSDNLLTSFIHYEVFKVLKSFYTLTMSAFFWSANILYISTFAIFCQQLFKHFWRCFFKNCNRFLRQLFNITKYLSPCQYVFCNKFVNNIFACKYEYHFTVCTN